MGVSIHGSAYVLADVVDQIDKYVKENGGYRDNALSAYDFLHKVAPEFGAIIDSHFVTVYNEYYEDYNPAYEFTKAVSTYYFPYVDIDEDFDKSFDLKNSIYFSGGASADEVLDDLFEDEFGYEGKFSDRWDEE
jgi:hypothetical protein